MVQVGAYQQEISTGFFRQVYVGLVTYILTEAFPQTSLDLAH